MSVEAGTTFGWHKYVGARGLAYGLDHFGTSAPAAAIAAEYGFTPQHIADAAAGLLASV
jgi:transketolase